MVRLNAAERLSDPALAQEVYADLALHGKDTPLLAAKKLADRELAQAAFARIARIDPDYPTRCSAIDMMADDAALLEIAQKDPDVRIRRAAAAQISSQSLLARIASSEDDYLVQVAAVQKLTDRSFLARVASTATRPQLRHDAEARLASLPATPPEAASSEPAGNLVRDGRGPCALCGKALVVRVTLDARPALSCDACGLAVCWEHDLSHVREEPCPRCGARDLWRNASVGE